MKPRLVATLTLVASLALLLAMSTAAQGPQSETAATVALGQPGFGFRYVQTFGATEQGYTPNNQHLNAPGGLYMDSSDNLYVVEDHGDRLLRFNSAGANTLALGVAGLCVDGNNPTRFCTPQDVALDSGGNIWVATGNRVVQFDSSGAYLQQLPVPSSSGSWSSGNDSTHFNFASGIAFDNTKGRMFVADGNNHRVQVYTFSGGSPVYSATIGVTGVSGSDNSHFNSPGRLAVDSSGRLYVVDTNNIRVQRCTPNGTWSCASFGSWSTSNWPEGIALDNVDNVYVFVSGNNGVVKCNSSGSCSSLVTDALYSIDVAVDSGGNIYVGGYGHGVIGKYNSSGGLIGGFIGTYDMSFVPDVSHIYSPWGIAVAADGSIYVAERFGYRFLKFNSTGVQQWAIGWPGGWGSDNDKFNTPEGKPAIATNGNVYVPDSGNHRVQIFKPDGTYVSTFGSNGTANNQFKWPVGIVISPLNGDIYVTDRDNHRVQVYDSNWNYKATLGVTGSSGSDATRFNSPRDVALDASGNIYVADRSNHRIQRCTLSGSSYICTTFAGVTGVSGSDFNHLNRPLGVAVDNAGRVYVVEESNNRVQVFDSSGAYLTTIGGSWGSSTGQLRSPSGIAIDGAGNVYVTDRENHRIQKFAPGVPGWLQTNINGFGNQRNVYVSTLATFGGQLYAGTRNTSGSGAQLWRTSDGSAWTAVITNGFGITRNVGIDHLIEFKNNLYAGTWTDTVNGSEVWRSSTGNSNDWTRVVSQGFGDTTNGEVFRFGVFSDTLYAATWSYTNTHGGEIWRSNTGDSGDWTRVITNGFGDAANGGVLTFEAFNGYLYAGTYNWNTAAMTSTGGEVWRTGNGLAWTQVNTAGFGSVNNDTVFALEAFKGNLYASTSYSGAGVQVWRCQVCDNSDWTKVVDSGWGNANRRGASALKVFDDRLYLVVGNPVTGMEVWRTSDGTHWEQVGYGGFGDSNNNYPYYDNMVAVFNNRLYIGTDNSANGGEVWLYLHRQVYLPVVLRN